MWKQNLSCNSVGGQKVCILSQGHVKRTQVFLPARDESAGNDENSKISLKQGNEKVSYSTGSRFNRLEPKQHNTSDSFKWRHI